MGRDWKYYWGGGSRTRRTCTAKSNNNNHDELVDSPSAGATGCCINAVFHLFHFQSSLCHHQVIPSFKQEQQQQLLSTTIKGGAEAPRNSLEEIQQQPPMPIEHFSSLNIPANHQIGIQIKTGSSRTRTELDLSSECSSPALKSPNLVARLMGLDLLPDQIQTIPLSSSSSSNKSRNLLKDSKTRTNNKFILDIDFMGGSRSLPETPRISSERRTSSNLDCHRLSLQINNRENIIPEFEQSRNSTGRRDVRVLLLDEENRSPGFYARQILVKKVKDDNIVSSRKVGSDITNTVNNRQSHDHQKQIIDDQIVLSKPNKQGTRSSPGHESASSSCSPRLRFLELKNRGVVSSGRVDHPKPSPKEQKHQKCGGIKKEIRRDQVLCINRQSSETIKKKKKEETFFQSEEKRPAFKKTPLSSSNVPKLFYPPKKDPPYPLTKLPDQKIQNQEYNDGRSSERSVQTKTSTVLQAVQERNGPGSPIGTVGNQSITETACTAGINKTVFDRLEPELMSYQSSLSLFDGSASVPNMSLRCNRLLIFDLFNEFLELEFSRKELRNDNYRMLKGPDLVRTVCQKIQNFPAVGCVVLEDIDTIIETDLQAGRRKLAILDEERERITEEIEREIMDKLVKETTSLLYYG